jgi:D-tyrosyl-tRNA(Tyr) deacylase
MRAVVQRVKRAEVRVGERSVSAIGTGFLVLLGVRNGDSEKDAEYLAEKVAALRVFSDEAGRMNLSLKDVGGNVLVVSQFTLYGDCRRGRRPSFVDAAPPQMAQRLYEEFIERLSRMGVEVKRGEFGASMEVELVGWGPVTLIIDSSQRA